MILRKQLLSEDTVKRFFPELFSDKEQYDYFIEVCALRLPNRKTLQSLHMQAARERHEDQMVMRELYSPIGCIRSSLDRPMREAQRETIYAQARLKLLEKARSIITDESHPYIRTLVTM